MKDNLMDKELLLDQETTPGVRYAPDIYAASAMEAARPMFEILSLKVSGETMTEFLKTSNGVVLLSSLGTLMSFLAHKKEVELASSARSLGR